MNPPSIEIVFLILSGVILLAGILYWFWSHLQLTQKKVQLLENAVFELRGMLTQRPESPGNDSGSNSGSGGNVAPSPYADLSDDEDWAAEEGSAASASASNAVEHVSTPLAALDATVTVVREGAEALMPGGRMIHAVAEAEEKTVDLHELVKEEEQFRELFVGGAAATPEKRDSSAEALESMPVKELRRLAEQRGIPGAADMRKKEILSALRSQVGNSSTVEVERTMDLAEITEEMPVLE